LKILFDHQYFSTQKHGGITRYFANLNQGLNEIPGIKATIGTLYSENEYFKNSPLNNSIGKAFFKGHNGRTYRWNKRYSNWLIKANDFDILHPTYYNTDLLKNLQRPFVITVHDMIHELFPTYFPDADIISAGKKQLIEKADAIIAISEHTKNDIIKFFPGVGAKISVVPHGYHHFDLQKANLSLPDKYILYVGDRAYYKNFNLFIKATAPILQADKDLNMVCVGGGRFNETELALLTQLKIELKCRQLTATDAELQQLYQQAQLFVFPSLQEGFGLPLLEAFANNCPVACSNATSFPEVAGDAAQYFDPLDENSIAGAVNEVLYNPGLRLRLIKEGQQRVQLFTQQNCVNNTLSVYKSVINAAQVKVQK
jgi:glycosyltransferase involved in cell wall biosynthesis